MRVERLLLLFAKRIIKLVLLCSEKTIAPLFMEKQF